GAHDLLGRGRAGDVDDVLLLRPRRHFGRVDRGDQEGGAGVDGFFRVVHGKDRPGADRAELLLREFADQLRDRRRGPRDLLDPQAAVARGAGLLADEIRILFTEDDDRLLAVQLFAGLLSAHGASPFGAVL